MKSRYGERDYGFGATMLTLRTAIGLTQAGLAKHVGVTRRAVAEWEAGSSYPKAEHLKEVITLAVKSQAFSSGNVAEEIRALWKAAHQKVLLDEPWLAALLLERSSSLGQSHVVPPVAEETMTVGVDQTGAAVAIGQAQADRGKPCLLPTFFKAINGKPDNRPNEILHASNG